MQTEIGSDERRYLPGVYRTRREVCRLLANKGDIIASWQIGNELMVRWVRMRPYRCTESNIWLIEQRALKKLRRFAPHLLADLLESVS